MWGSGLCKFKQKLVTQYIYLLSYSVFIKEVRFLSSNQYLSVLEQEAVATGGEVVSKRPTCSKGPKMSAIYSIYALSGVAALVVFFLDYVGKYEASKLSSYVGILFLAPTIIPNNIIRFKFGPVSRLINPVCKVFLAYRKHIGISAGVWFIVHALLGWPKYLNFSVVVLYSREIVLGSVSLIIFGLLLATSNAWSTHLLKKKWKYLQALIWFVIPIAFLHSILSSIKYTHEWSKPALLGFTPVLIFVGVEFLLLLTQNHRDKWRHLAYTGAGLTVAGLTLLLYR